MLSLSTALAHLVLVSCVLFTSLDASPAPASPKKDAKATGSAPSSPKRNPPHVTGSFAERSILLKQMPGVKSAIKEVNALLKALDVPKSGLLSLAHIGHAAKGPFVCVFQSRKMTQKAMANRGKLAEDEHLKGVELFAFHSEQEGEKDVRFREFHRTVGVVPVADVDEFSHACLHLEFYADAKVRELLVEEQAQGDYCITLKVMARLIDAHLHDFEGHIVDNDGELESDEEYSDEEDEFGLVLHEHEEHYPMHYYKEGQEEQGESRSKVHPVSLKESNSAEHRSPKHPSSPQNSPEADGLQPNSVENSPKESSIQPNSVPNSPKEHKQ